MADAHEALRRSLAATPLEDILDSLPAADRAPDASAVAEMTWEARDADTLRRMDKRFFTTASAPKGVPTSTVGSGAEQPQVDDRFRLTRPPGSTAS